MQTTNQSKHQERNERRIRSEEKAQSIDEVPFSILTRLFEELRNARSNKRPRGGRGGASHQRTQDESRHSILTRNWLELCRYVKSSNERLASNEIKGREIVPAQLLNSEDSMKVVSLIVPELDSTHSYLGMKESKLADAFIKALDLTRESEDAQWLKHYKEKAYRPLKYKQDTNIIDSDLPTIIQAVLTGRCNEENSTLTIGMVWNVLNTLSQVTTVRNRRIMKMNYMSNDDNFVDSKNIGVKAGSKADIEDEKKYNALITLVQNGTRKEVAEVSRIILKDLNMRLSRDNFFSWFHPAAKQHFTQIHNLHKLLKDCYNPSFEIGDAAVQLGQYASVMLTMRPTRKNLPTICENLCGGTENSDVPKENDGSMMQIEDMKSDQKEDPYFIMEPKLDGERLQLHKWYDRNENDNNADKNINAISGDDDPDVRIRTFSRRGHDSSAMYADALHEVICKGVRARDVILDGEIMIWDNLRDTWVRFENMREKTTAIAKQSIPEGESYTIKFMIFDVLFVQQQARPNNGSSQPTSGNMVMRLPLHKRRELLEKLIPKRTEITYGPGVIAAIEIVQMEKGRVENELMDTLQRYETLGYEGVIAKHPDKPYVLAERNLEVAIKLKPDYFDGGLQDIDVLILGAKYSSSRGRSIHRSGKLSSFLIGVRDDSIETCEENEELIRKEGKWIAVGSIGTGYSDNDLAEIQKRLSNEWRDLNMRDLPSHFEKKNYSSNVYTTISKWVPPWKSIVLTVKAYELNRRLHVLRFPRCERIRFDKPYYDVVQMAELRDLDEHKLPVVIKGDDNDDDDVMGRDGNNDSKGRRQKQDEIDSEEEEILRLAKEEGIAIRDGKRGSRTIMDGAVGANVSKIDVKSDALSGTVVTVVAQDQDKKALIEVKVHKLGGSFVQNVTKNVQFVIVCDEPSIRSSRAVQTVKKSLDNGTEENSSIVMREWIDACEKENKRVTLKGEWVVAANAHLQKEVYKECDRFGDWWRKDADPYGFQRALAKVEADAIKSFNFDQVDKEVWDILDECEKDCGMIFHNVVIFPRNKSRSMGSLGLVKAFGGKVVHILDDKVTHVLNNNDDNNDEVPERCKRVNEEWIRQCVDLKTLCN